MDIDIEVLQVGVGAQTKCGGTLRFLDSLNDCYRVLFLPTSDQPGISTRVIGMVKKNDIHRLGLMS